jgi:hypothetical protein
LRRCVQSEDGTYEPDRRHQHTHRDWPRALRRSAGSKPGIVGYHAELVGFGFRRWC